MVNFKAEFTIVKEDLAQQNVIFEQQKVTMVDSINGSRWPLHGTYNYSLNGLQKVNQKIKTESKNNK